MKNVTLWRVGLVRAISILVFSGGFHGLVHGLKMHQRWNIEAMSMPTSVALIMCALGLYILGFRTERDREQISKQLSPKRRIHSAHPGRHTGVDRHG